jgi:hypothetical protein
VFPPVRLRGRALSGRFRRLELSPDAFAIFFLLFPSLFVYNGGCFPSSRRSDGTNSTDLLLAPAHCLPFAPATHWPCCGHYFARDSFYTLICSLLHLLLLHSIQSFPRHADIGGRRAAAGPQCTSDSAARAAYNSSRGRCSRLSPYM